MAPPDASGTAGRPSLAETCSQYLTSHRAQLVDAVEDGQRGTDVAARFSQMFDGLFSTLFCAAEAEQRAANGPLQGAVALVAVGGYGRSLVAPRSDVDVLLLCEHPEDPRVASLAEAMLYPLWDAGVDVGHAIRGFEDTLQLSRADIRTSTTLLDMRHLAGDASIVERLNADGRKLICEEELAAFLQALRSDTEARHERFGGTLYLREPEIKLGRGGLRDLDVITWMGRASFGVDDLQGIRDAGGLTEAELIDLRAATEHLWSVRNELHLSARRRQDRLTFEDQESVANRLGYRDDQRLGVERFMQAHYRHARVVARLVDMMAERARRAMRPPPSTIRDISPGLRAHDQHIVLDEGTALLEPATVLRLYGASYAQRLPPDPAARDTVAALCTDREWCQRLRRDPKTPGLFLTLLVTVHRSPMRAGSFLLELHELGLLLALIPEFEPIMGRVAHDAYHAYTSDVEAVKAVDRLRELARGALVADYPIASRAAAEAPRPVPLYMALLLRSIGAGHPDDPARHAAALAAPICERLQLPESDLQHVQWLVQNQQAFAHWALRRDITDPETIEEVAAEVGALHRLRDLYLLAFCDLSTTRPGAMTAWNARMFADLFTNTAAYLEQGPSATEQLGDLRKEATRGVDNEAERQAIEAFLREMPDRYLLANTAEGARFHATHAERDGAAAAVATTPSGVGEGMYELMVVADDRPGVLADLAAALAVSRFSVDSAQLYTRERANGRREAFDLFHINHSSMGIGVDLEAEIEELRSSVEAVISGQVTAEALIAKVPKKPSWERSGPRIRTEVNVDNSASSRFTVVEVYTRDGPSLLFTIADTLRKAGLSIASAKVNTQGDRVADIFYVELQAGGRLEADGQFGELSGTLRKAIRALGKG